MSISIGDRVKCIYTTNTDKNRNILGNIGTVVSVYGDNYCKIHFEQSTYKDEDGYYEYCCYTKDLIKLS